MDIVYIDSINDFRTFLDRTDQYSGTKVDVFIRGAALSELSRTYVAYGKQQTAQAAALAAAGIAAFSAFATLGAALVLAGPATAAAALANSYALKEFHKSPYAREVARAEDLGFKFVINNGDSIKLRKK